MAGMRMQLHAHSDHCDPKSCDIARRQKASHDAYPRSEQALMKRIMVAIGSLPDLLIWRNQPGKAEVWDARTGAPRMLTFGVIGSADIMGVLKPSGRIVGLEVKTATGRLEPHQTTWAERIRSFGGFVCVVRSEAEAVEAIERARCGLSE